MSRAVTGTERGAGLLSATFGLAFFLGFLMLATQLMVRLYQTSALTSDAYRAARAAAGDAVQRGGPSAVAQEMALEGSVLQRRYAHDGLTVRWGPLDAGDVELTLTIHPTTTLVSGLDGILGIGVISRTVRVHRERLP